jgi:hypothetical protein
MWFAVFYGITNRDTCRCGNNYGFTTDFDTFEGYAPQGACGLTAAGAEDQAGGGENAIVVWEYYNAENFGPDSDNPMPVSIISVTCSLLKSLCSAKLSLCFLQVSQAALRPSPLSIWR